MMSEAKYLPILVELLLANLLWVEDETKVLVSISLSEGV